MKFREVPLTALVPSGHEGVQTEVSHVSAGGRGVAEVLHRARSLVQLRHPPRHRSRVGGRAVLDRRRGQRGQGRPGRSENYFMNTENIWAAQKYFNNTKYILSTLGGVLISIDQS